MGRSQCQKHGLIEMGSINLLPLSLVLEKFEIKHKYFKALGMPCRTNFTLAKVTLVTFEKHYITSDAGEIEIFLWLNYFGALY